MKRKAKFFRHLVLGALLVISAVAALRTATAGEMPSAGAVAAPAANSISINNFSFQPAVLVVTAGTKVTWRNHDSTPHTVTSADKRFASSAGLDTGDQYSFKFDKPGSYVYFCSLHPMMVGKIIVQAAG